MLARVLRTRPIRVVLMVPLLWGLTIQVCLVMVLIRFIRTTSLHAMEERSGGLFFLEEVGLGSHLCMAIRPITMLGGRTQQFIRITGIRAKSETVC